MEVVGAGAPDHAVQHAEVEFSLLPLDLVPGNARQDEVDPGLNQARPDPRHVLEAGGAVVVQFPRQRQERLAVDHQLGGCPVLLKVRDFRRRGCRDYEGGHQSCATQGSNLHGVHL